MKFYIQAAILFLSCLSFFSCEQGELLNSEADIIEVILPDNMKVGKPIITNDKVRIPKIALTKEDSTELAEQIKNLAPRFVLTPGAVISDEGVARDFTTPQTYIVTSEDKEWSKKYTVSFFDSKFDRTEFSFSNYELFDGKKQYYTFFEIDDRTGEKQLVWDSGNGGFALTAKESTPAGDYPTSSILDGKNGAGVKLTTSSTGTFGMLVGMPIAAGNLFLGRFILKDATSKPLEATQFGVSTLMDEPKKLTLWCKYKAGEEYKDKYNNVYPDIIDSPEVYAVLYEPKIDGDGKAIMLNGTNIRTADNIISMAVMQPLQIESIRVNDIVNDPYTFVEIPFIPTLPIKEFDPEKQEKGKYYIALVFSSSANGNLFEGAVGSTLYVDEVKFTK